MQIDSLCVLVGCSFRLVSFICWLDGGHVFFLLTGMFVAGDGFVRVGGLMESGPLMDHAQRPSVVEVMVFFLCSCF